MAGAKFDAVFFGHLALSVGIGVKRSFFLRKGYNFPEHLIFRLVP